MWLEPFLPAHVNRGSVQGSIATVESITHHPGLGFLETTQGPGWSQRVSPQGWAGKSRLNE